MWETIKQVIGLLFGGSKWTMVIIVVAVAGLGIYGINTINDLQSKLDTMTTNNDTLKDNLEKLETAKIDQDKTINHLKTLLNLSSDINKDLVNNINLRNKDLNTLKIKLDGLNKAKKEILLKPNEYEQKINKTMETINSCFEELSRKDLNNVNNTIEDTNNDKKEDHCSVDALPDFTYGLF